MPLAATRTLCTLLIGGCLQHISGAILRRSGAASKSHFLQPQGAISVWPPETESGATTSTTPQITSSVAPVASTTESQASSVSLSPSPSASNQESQSLPLGSSSSPPASPTSSNSSSSNSDSTSRGSPLASGSSSPSATAGGGGGTAAAAARPASPTDPIIPTATVVHGDPPPPTVPPCEKTAVAPIAGVPTFGDMFDKVNVTSGCKCNCSQPMNETAVLHQLMNVAYHSADNAQAALEAVGKLDTSKNASQTAEHADQVATEALVIWNHLSGTFEKIEASTVTAEDRLQNLVATARKAANGYDQAIQQAREMSPQWPPGVR